MGAWNVYLRYNILSSHAEHCVPDLPGGGGQREFRGAVHKRGRKYQHD